MHIIISLIIGGVVGWLASLVMKTDAQMGIVANVLVGIGGSVLGFFVFGALGFGAYGFVARTIVSMVGAIGLIAALKALKVFK